MIRSGLSWVVMVVCFSCGSGSTPGKPMPGLVGRGLQRFALAFPFFPANLCVRSGPLEVVGLCSNLQVQVVVVDAGICIE